MLDLLKCSFICLALLITADASWADDKPLEYFRDVSTQLSISEAREPSLEWQTTTRDKANFGFTSDAVWLRLPIDNPSVSTIVKHLRINYPLLDHVDAYLIHQGELIEHKYLSDRIPYNEDRQHDKYYLFNYTLEAASSYQV